MFAKDYLKQQLKDMGIKPDDTVLIHTSYKSIGEVEGGIDGLIDTFKEYLSEGLFIIPTHTWSVVTRENPIYDAKTTIPCIGAVPVAAAFRKDGIRSLHPTHSVWATGKNAKAFTEGDEYAETPAPVGGCWYRLAELGAKILLIGVGNNRNTFIHAVDEMANLDDRLVPQPWDVTVIDYDGRKITHPFRNHGMTGSANFGNFDKMFIAKGVQTFGQLGAAEVKICDAKKCTEVLLDLYSKVEENLCLEAGEIPEHLYKNTMRIRKAEKSDWDAIQKVYAVAREYMRQSGNPDQWGTEKPRKELLEDDIRKGQLFVGENEEGEIHFVFAFILGEDPTYSYIENGSWLSDAPYGTIHRIASDGTVSGVVKMAVTYCRKTISNIRIDTHEKNKTMQHVLGKLGFKKCGIIYIDDGTPRIAYQLL